MAVSAFAAGMKCRCPNCGEGRVYRGFLTFKERCDACGADLTIADAGDGPAPGAEPLTRKEIRVLQLLAEGHSNGVLAERLSVSDSTVRTHLRNINLKLHARSRTQAVALARRLGVIG